MRSTLNGIIAIQHLWASWSSPVYSISSRKPSRSHLRHWRTFSSCAAAYRRPLLSHQRLPRQKYPEHRAPEGCNIPWRRNDVIVLRRETPGGRKRAALHENKRNPAPQARRIMRDKWDKNPHGVYHCGLLSRWPLTNASPPAFVRPFGMGVITPASRPGQNERRRAPFAVFAHPIGGSVAQASDLAGRAPHGYGSAQARNRALQPAHA